MAGERVFEGLPASVSPITGDLPAAKSGQETSGIPLDFLPCNVLYY